VINKNYMQYDKSFYYGLKIYRLFIIFLRSKILIYLLLTLFSLRILPEYHLLHYIMYAFLLFLTIDVASDIQMEFFSKPDYSMPTPYPMPEDPNLLNIYSDKYVVINGLGYCEFWTVADSEYESKRIFINLPETSSEKEIDEAWDWFYQGPKSSVAKVTIKIIKEI